MLLPIPRSYMFPSAITALAVAVLPAALLGLLYVAMRSPSWDPNGDSGASAGFMIFAFEALTLVAYAALAFPLVARGLHKWGRYRRGTFIVANFAGLLLVSAVVAAVVSFQIFGNGSIYPRRFLFMVVEAALFCLPFSLLWIRLAK